MNRVLRCFVLAPLSLAVFALPVMADWNVGDPYKMHYPQLPDLTPTGMDILATIQPPGGAVPQWKILADDWQCTQSGPVSDIHIWGSWRYDELPMTATGAPDPANVVFKLSIHKDIPANSGIDPRPFSRPGDLIWQQNFQPGQFAVRPYAQLPPTTPGESFFDPNLNQVIGEDHVVWQYNFTKFPNPFPQQEGNIYWLDVQAIAMGPNGLEDPTKTFGWKTTNPLETPHFMDDAVFGDTAGFGGPLDAVGWRPLVYPLGHQFEMRSIDMAFVITVPEPGTIVMLIGAVSIGLGVVTRRRWAKKA